MAKSLLIIAQQYRRICDNWDRSKHNNKTWRKVFNVYSQYLINIGKAEGVCIPEHSDYMPGVASMIAFPKDYYLLPHETINRSQEFQAAKTKMYPRSVYAASV